MTVQEQWKVKEKLSNFKGERCNWSVRRFNRCILPLGHKGDCCSDPTAQPIPDSGDDRSMYGPE